MRHVLPGNITVVFEREVIEVKTLVPPTEPDPDCTYRDKAGHLHDWTKALLRWKVIRTWWCEDCRDEHTDEEQVCILCGEKIEPGRQPAPNPAYIQGLMDARLEAEDGRVWALRPEEMPKVDATDGLVAWAAKIMEREPDTRAWRSS